MTPARFKAWIIVRLRGRGPYKGSVWRVAAHIYRERALNLCEALAGLQADIHTWETAYDELEVKHALYRELYDDVQRWRETGGDPRDLRYVLDTVEKIERTHHDT